MSSSLVILAAKANAKAIGVKNLHKNKDVFLV